MNRDERLAVMAQAAGLLAVAAALTGFLLLGAADWGAVLAKPAIPVAALLTLIAGVLGLIARWRLSARPLSDRFLRYAINGTTLSVIALLLLLFLFVAVPSNRNAVRHLRARQTGAADPAP